MATYTLSSTGSSAASTTYGALYPYHQVRESTAKDRDCSHCFNSPLSGGKGNCRCTLYDVPRN